MGRNLPRYRKCFVCGKGNPIGLNITFRRCGNDEVCCEFSLDERYIGYPGRVHGGVVAAVLDEIMGWACSVSFRRFYYTVEFSVRYKKPIEPGRMLAAKAKAKAEKHGIAMATATLEYEDGTVVATSRGNYYPLSEEETKKLLPLLHHEPEDGTPVSMLDL